MMTTGYDGNNMDYLTFKTLIGINTLIVFYYIGAVILPIVLWVYAKPLIAKYKLMSDSYFKGKEFLWKLLDKKQKIRLIGIGIPLFIFIQILWRLLFEFLIAFMQIRDALLPAVS